MSSVIWVDPRAGSQDLLQPLLDAGLPAKERLLGFGDVAFMGRGEKGREVFIGIEHKKVPDLLSSLSTDRLAGHQLLGMVDRYDRPWLLIEGDWEHDGSGRTVLWGGRGRRRPARGAPPAVELEKRVLTLETRGGFRVRWCKSRRDSIRFLIALYRFWTDKDLDEHKSHLAMHAPDFDTAMKPSSDWRQMVARIPGIGYKTSEVVEAHFEGSLRRMLMAPVQEWAELTTEDGKGHARRLGNARAKAIVEFLRK